MSGEKKTVEVEKLKISKTFKIVNPVPKFQSVPATPQFFDMAAAHLEYPNLDESIAKYRPQGGVGGLFSRLKTGIWGK